MEASLRKKGLRKKLGQNTAEYLLMLTLVVVGSIGLLTAFGKTVQGKFAQMSAAISGKEEVYKTSREASEKGSQDALVRAQKEISMSGVSDEELKYSLSGAAGKDKKK